MAGTAVGPSQKVYSVHLQLPDSILDNLLKARNLVGEGTKRMKRTQLTLWEFSLSQNHDLRTEIYCWIDSDDTFLDDELNRLSGSREDTRESLSFDDKVKILILVSQQCTM